MRIALALRCISPTCGASRLPAVHLAYLRFLGGCLARRKPLLRTCWPLSPFSETLEEHLASVVSPVGTLIAIGHPNEKLPTPGGLRLYEREHDWHQAVIQLMQDAEAVIIQASRSTPGLRWEIGECKTYVQPERLLILVYKLTKRDYEYFSLFFSMRHNLVLASSRTARAARSPTVANHPRTTRA
jgi:hypothetical protein